MLVWVTKVVSFKLWFTMIFNYFNNSWHCLSHEVTAYTWVTDKTSRRLISSQPDLLSFTFTKRVATFLTRKPAIGRHTAIAVCHLSRRGWWPAWQTTSLFLSFSIMNYAAPAMAERRERWKTETRQPIRAHPGEGRRAKLTCSKL